MLKCNTHQTAKNVFYQWGYHVLLRTKASQWNGTRTDNSLLRVADITDCDVRISNQADQATVLTGRFDNPFHSVNTSASKYNGTRKMVTLPLLCNWETLLHITWKTTINLLTPKQTNKKKKTTQSSPLPAQIKIQSLQRYPPQADHYMDYTPNPSVTTAEMSLCC